MMEKKAIFVSFPCKFFSINHLHLYRSNYGFGWLVQSDIYAKIAMKRSTFLINLNNVSNKTKLQTDQIMALDSELNSNWQMPSPATGESLDSFEK